MAKLLTDAEMAERRAVRQAQEDAQREKARGAAEKRRMEAVHAQQQQADDRISESMLGKWWRG